MKLRTWFRWALLAALFAVPAWGQEKSVKPGINDQFRDPDVKTFAGRFEVESREVYARRKEIVDACGLKPGLAVADIGAGTGLFTRQFAQAVGPEGKVFAVDIAQKFLDHVAKTCEEAGLKNVQTILGKDDATGLAPDSVDLVFICDTYHHFEFPQKMLASIHRALKPGGRIVLIDFRRVEGQSTDWVLNHVRAGQGVFEQEVTQAGFRKMAEPKDVLKENYLVIFEKTSDKASEKAGAVPAGPGRGLGMGRGMGRGPNPQMRADQEVFHYLLDHHAQIRRTVKTLDNGVETVTESDNPEVAKKIQEHVAAMHERVKSGHGLRYWDELFATLFEHHAKIAMTYERIEKGVRVKETSENPYVAKLVQAHAAVVSKFVESGFDEAHQNHPAPAATADLAPRAADASQLVFPIVKGFGGAVARPNAAAGPRAGAKFLFDITADSKPTDVNKGLERAARLLNLYGASGLQASDVKLTLVLHGDATKAALSDEAYADRFGGVKNPNRALLVELAKAGVEVYVCGQALHAKKFADSEVASDVTIAVSALTLSSNRQADGFGSTLIP